MLYPGFCGGYGKAQSSVANPEDLVNWYIERTQGSDGVKTCLYPTPGVTKISDAASGAGRAHIFQNRREFAVIGDSFVEISQAGIQTVLGTVAVDSNPAVIVGNGDAGNQLLITSGGNAYVYDLVALTFNQIAFFNGIAFQCAYLDGFGLILDVTTSTVYISALLDLSTWDPTDFIQNSATTDNWVAMYVANRLIYLFGRMTTQVWYNTGESPIPFSLHPSGVMEWGIGAQFSPAVVGGQLYWIGQNKNGAIPVVRTGGYSGEVVSQYAVNVAFDSYPTVADAIGDSYEDLGHGFYLLTFPTAEKSWHYDPVMNSWARRGYWDSASRDWKATRQFFNAYAFSQHRVLDPNGSGVYVQTSDVSTDIDGAAIRRVRIAPVLSDENKLVRYPQLELDMECGLGTLSGQGSDPVVMAQFSRDGGKTYGPETFRSAGKRGEYGTRVQWNRCGSARRFVVKIIVSDPVPYRILGAYLKVGRPSEQA